MERCQSSPDPLDSLLRALDGGIVIEPWRPWRRSQGRPIECSDRNLRVRVERLAIQTSGHREWEVPIPTWTQAA